jgi:outer membrane lipoprotein-sorting protein
METGELLDLLHGARERYRSLRADVASWVDHDRAEAARRRLSRGQRYGISERQMVGEGGAPAETEHVGRIWLEWPARARHEEEIDHAGERIVLVSVVDGERWWTSDPVQGLVTSADDPEARLAVVDEFRHLIDPALILGAFRFEQLGDGEAAGRRALRLRAIPRYPPGDPVAGPLPVASGDEHELLVDRERGVILAWRCLADGEPFARTEFSRVRFDDRFPPELFWPPGAAVSPG